MHSGFAPLLQKSHFVYSEVAFYFAVNKSLIKTEYRRQSH